MQALARQSARMIGKPLVTFGAQPFAEAAASRHARCRSRRFFQRIMAVKPHLPFRMRRNLPGRVPCRAFLMLFSREDKNRLRGLTAGRGRT